MTYKVLLFVVASMGTIYSISPKPECFSVAARKPYIITVKGGND